MNNLDETITFVNIINSIVNSVIISNIVDVYWQYLMFPGTSKGIYMQVN
jgi:hypothetical protein